MAMNKYERGSGSMDQYEKYERLPVLLQRFSFYEKMRIACIYSSRAIAFNVEDCIHNGDVFPWCIETFVMLSIEAKEYGHSDFKGKNEKKFLKMCNAIWNGSTMLIDKKCGRFSLPDLVLPLTALTQAELQELNDIKKYRYWVIFGDDTDPVRLKTTFKEKMGTEYEDFLLLGSVIQVMLFTQYKVGKAIPQDVLKYLICQRFSVAAPKLLITRENYVKLLHTYVKDDTDKTKYIYSLRPSIQFPFIQYDKSIYFPLPHLIAQSITSALMYRITDQDDELRTAIGKNIWEKYLLKLLKDSNCYNEVFPEQEYRNQGSVAKSPDVLARQGDDVLFLDSKSSVPGIGIRIFDEDTYEKNIRIIAEYIVKLFKQIRLFEKYNPFSERTTINFNRCWRVVVILEDSYIRRQYYYEKALEILKMNKESDEAKWIITHIKVASLYEVERLSLCGVSIIDAFREAFKEDPYSYAFLGFPSDSTNTKIKSADFIKFRQTYEAKIDMILQEIKALGYMS